MINKPNLIGLIVSSKDANSRDKEISDCFTVEEKFQSSKPEDNFKLKKPTFFNNKDSLGYTGLVDTLGSISYSLILGAGLDYYTGLKTLKGIIGSRASATLMNSVTGGPYGLWRDFLYKKTKTTEKSSKIKKYLVDLVAFNIFQVPIYGLAVGIGGLVQDGELNFNKMIKGYKNLALLSPLIGPTMGLYMNLMRNCFGSRTAAEKVSRE